MASMDVTIINTMTDDYNKQNAVAVGLATGASNVELPNLSDGATISNGFRFASAGTTLSGFNAFTTDNGFVGGTQVACTINNNGSITLGENAWYTINTGTCILTRDPSHTLNVGLEKPQNIKIDASDGLSPGELYAVGRSASNTETKDQALTITPQKMDSVLKSIERDAKA